MEKENIEESYDIMEPDELPRELPQNNNDIMITPPLPKKRKTDEGDTLQDKINTAFSILKSNYNVQKKDGKKDYCGMYTDLLAEKLRKLDDRTRDTVMNRIDNMLYNITSNSTFENRSTSSIPQICQESQYISNSSPCFSGTSTFSHNINMTPQSVSAHECVDRIHKDKDYDEKYLYQL